MFPQQNYLIPRRFTGFRDDNNNSIYVADKLQHKDGYKVEVWFHADESIFFGRLIVEDIRDYFYNRDTIPINLNKGNGFTKIS